MSISGCSNYKGDGKEKEGEECSDPGSGGAVCSSAVLCDPGIYPAGRTSVRGLYRDRNSDRYGDLSLWPQLFHLAGHAGSQYTGCPAVQPEHQPQVYRIFTDSGCLLQPLSSDISLYPDV